MRANFPRFAGRDFFPTGNFPVTFPKSLSAVSSRDQSWFRERLKLVQLLEAFQVSSIVNECPAPTCDRSKLPPNIIVPKIQFPLFLSIPRIRLYFPFRAIAYERARLVAANRGCSLPISHTLHNVGIHTLYTLLTAFSSLSAYKLGALCCITSKTVKTPRVASTKRQRRHKRMYRYLSP